MSRYLHSIITDNLIALVVILLLIFSCSDTSNKNRKIIQQDYEELSSEKNIALDKLIDSLLENIQWLEYEAFSSEKEKIESTKSLIEEIKLTVDKYDEILLDSISFYRNKMEKTLYTKNNFNQLKIMEKYDLFTLYTVNAIEKLVAQIPNFNNYQRAYLLYKDILKADKSDFSIRKNYNIYARSLNSLLEKRGDKIRKMGRKYQNISKIKIFYGNSTS